MTVHYRIFDVHEPASDAFTEGTATFRHVVGDVIFAGFAKFRVEECRMRHTFDHHKADKEPSMSSIDLMCVRWDK